MLLPSPFDDRVAFFALEHPTGELFEFTPAELSVAPRGASAERRIEFALGRRAALHALMRLGHPASSPLPRRERLPVWPTGIKGSISHTRYGDAIRAVAAVGIDTKVSALGLDIEAIRPISERVLRRIAHPAELAWIAAGDASRRAVALFAAREALYKAIHPLYRQPMHYRETHLDWDDELGGFRGTTALPQLGASTIKSVVNIRSVEDLVVAGVALDAELSLEG